MPKEINMPVPQHQLCRPLTQFLSSKLPLNSRASASPRASASLTVVSLSVAHANSVPSSPGNSSLPPFSPSYSIVASLGRCGRDNVEQLVENNLDMPRVDVLKQKMQLLGIDLDNYCLPGQYQNLFCPKCKGGRVGERSLSFHIMPDGEFAMWRCFRTSCGWAGQAFADEKELYRRVGQKSYGTMTEESLGLEPVGPKLIAYFKERLISEKTLSRNAVMQMSDNKNVIAFTYKQNGLLVGCKYRTMEKRFWQGKGTNKILYGLDDISDAAEIIIVEGEIDKLSLEEAGFRNCVSVPGGAPSKVSSRGLPPVEKDTGYQYLWNCKEYLDKVDRILLATDSDSPGQALAEELARRLGRERCWKVHWPNKDKQSLFKDANDVLIGAGADDLKGIVENAKPY